MASVAYRYRKTATKGALVALGLIAIFFWFVIAQRYICLFAFLSLIGVGLTRGHLMNAFLACTGLFLAMTVTPYDIAFEVRKGGPKFLPYVVGLPGARTAARARRGEIVLAGCCSTGFDPKYVLVW